METLINFVSESKKNNLFNAEVQTYSISIFLNL